MRVEQEAASQLDSRHCPGAARAVTKRPWLALTSVALLKKSFFNRSKPTPNEGFNETLQQGQPATSSGSGFQYRQIQSLTDARPGTTAALGTGFRISKERL